VVMVDLLQMLPVAVSLSVSLAGIAAAALSV
jgi:hypothetical protein